MKQKFTGTKRRNMTGWAFLLPATILIFAMSFYPMIQAFILSFKSGIGNNLVWSGLSNYKRLLGDGVFKTAMVNNFVYLIIQVPVMLILAILLAVLLNKPHLKCKGLFRTAIFLPCCTALVSYSIIFKTLFAYDGYVNTVLLHLGLIHSRINWLGQTSTAKVILIIALIWRWTGYNMVFYLAGLQNIDGSLYEAATIDGAGPVRRAISVVLPLAKEQLLVCSIITVIGAFKLFTEVYSTTAGGPGNSTQVLGLFLYQNAFLHDDLGMAAVTGVFIFVITMVLSVIQLKVTRSGEV